MSFVAVYEKIPIERLLTQSSQVSPAEVERTLARRNWSYLDFPSLISPAAGQNLEKLGQISQRITQQRFGKTVRLFAPLYLSNECINNCKYCGFSRDNPIFRVTLSVPEVEKEAAALSSAGFRSILLVAGEQPKFISADYLRDCVAGLRPMFPSISLEIGPMNTEEYRPLVDAGAEGLVVYQETYDRSVYASVHTAGPKRDFNWRLETPERAYAAGFRRLGIGALYGLSDWRLEAFHLAAHLDYLLKHCWKAQLTISLPRLRPHAGDFEPLTRITDRELLQLICAFRLAFPDVGIVLSTREPARLRNGLIPLGITHMSAGSHTEPGGYTGAGKENLHKTERGRVVALDSPGSADAATGQFQIADERTPAEIAHLLSGLGYEPVWKDWDPSLVGDKMA
ncbi:MAG: 2-iminoacetate synthase ThiH [Verrucomicrobiota bacterium]|nr:2-iminoacetate synthase ThiH [Verrucomicrobiota bacterium]